MHCISYVETYRNVCMYVYIGIHYSAYILICTYMCIYIYIASVWAAAFGGKGIFDTPR